MREPSRTAVAAAAIVATASAAACGGGGGPLSRAQYEQKLKAEGSQLRSAVAGLNLASVGGNLQVLASKLATAQTKVEHAASDIDKLRPPPDAVADNDRIARSLHTFARVFGRMHDAAASGKRARVLV